MRMIITALAAVIALSGVAAAQEDMSPLFPKPQEVGGWVVSFDIEHYPGEKIYDFINGAGEAFVQYNFEVAAAAEYAGPDDAAIQVEIYRMKTPEDAYGIFAYHRPATAETLPLSQAAFVLGMTGGLWKDVYYVKVYGIEEMPGIAEAVKEFLALVSRKIPNTGNLPEIFDTLDVEGFQKGSARFARTNNSLKRLHFVSEDNVLNLGDGTTMAFADYVLKAREFQVFVILYPSEQEAVTAAAKYTRFLGANPEANAAWYKQSGKAIVGAWPGQKVSETLDSQDMIYDTMLSILAKVKVFQLQR